MTPRLGRLIEFDPRSKNYQVEPPKKLERTFRYHYHRQPRFDQQGGTCVGHGVAHALMDGPRTQKVPDNLRYDIYDLATTLDQWPGNEGDREFGTSILAGMKAAVQLGYVTKYLWAYDLDTLVRHVLMDSPAVIGVNFYAGMAKAKAELSGELWGGHAMEVVGANTKTRLFKVGNSWKELPFIIISFDDMAELIRQDGEIAVAIGEV